MSSGGVVDDDGGIDPVLAPPSLISWLLGLTAIAVQCAFTYRGQTAGQLAHLQFAAVVSGFISACGSMVSNFGAYSTGAPGDWCQFEAWCSSFGELALILWVICTALYTGMQIRQWPSDAATRSKVVYYFHAPVWGLALLMTVIPAGTRSLGLYVQHNGEYWCWMKRGNRGWEWAQFYVPLLLSNVISVCAFVLCITTLLRVRDDIARMRRRSTVGTAAELDAAARKESKEKEEQMWLYIRLAAQFFVLFLVFVPDSITYYQQYDNEPTSDSEDAGSRFTHFMWKCEGAAVSLLWFWNLRVRQEFMALPPVVAFVAWCHENDRCGCCPTACTCCHASAAAAPSSGSGARNGGGGHSKSSAHGKGPRSTEQKSPSSSRAPGVELGPVAAAAIKAPDAAAAPAADAGVDAGAAGAASASPGRQVTMANCSVCQKLVAASVSARCPMCDEPICSDEYCSVKKGKSRVCRSCSIQADDQV